LQYAALGGWFASRKLRNVFRSFHSITHLIEEELVVTIVRVGTNKKFSEGWDAAFGGKKAQKKTATKGAKKTAAPSAKKKAKKK